MKTSKELLSSVLKTIQIEQTGIRSVLDAVTNPVMRSTLESQLQEYDRIESEAYTIAGQRGWDLTDLDPALQFFLDRTTRLKLNRGNCDSKIADIMIHGNTKWMVKRLKDLHRYPHSGDHVSNISQKLVDCETANIRQMRRFL